MSPADRAPATICEGTAAPSQIDRARCGTICRRVRVCALLGAVGALWPAQAVGLTATSRPAADCGSSPGGGLPAAIGPSAPDRLSL